MSRQDKATTERHTRTLRELVKRPENKFCGDCKKNDARWASWNIGVFVCIRCSGIHRSMGTHISKVKSVDLDTWTPEQMACIQKWGNKRANAYWEAHLKAGHAPPDHKIDSFIRSKYESRRWAMEGAPPEDPSVLDDPSEAAPQPAPVPAAVAPAHPAAPSRPTSVPAAQPAAPVRTATHTTTQPQARQLLSTSLAGRTPVAVAATPTSAVTAAPAAPPAAPAPQNDLFSLDFHAPSPAHGATNGNATPKKDAKNDIMSLFSTGPAAAAAAPAINPYAQPAGFGQFGGTGGTGGSPWGDGLSGTAPQPQQPQQAAPQSMMGTAGAGMWGVNSGWSAPAQPAQPNIWGNTGPSPGTQQTFFNTSDVWASNGAGASAGSTSGGADLFGSFGAAPAAPQQQKKDDAFGDLWGGFK